MSKYAQMNVGLGLAVLPLALRANAIYGQMPQLQPRTVAEAQPSLSVIIPARNEAQNLRRLLPTLRQLNYPGPLELIVVNDGSTDETVAVAEEFDVRVVDAPDLPAGWCGKPHACHVGAQVANGEWLLFTDADTVHSPPSAATAVAYAQEHRLDGLSLFLHQETRGWLDKVILMVAFAGLFAGLRKSAPTLNGQYILVRKAVYDHVGGYAKVRNEMLEDLALGSLLHEEGYLVPIVRGELLAQVCMYAELRQLWQGMARLGSGSLRWSGVGSLVTALFVTGAMMPFVIPLFARKESPAQRHLWLVSGSVLVGFIPWSRRFDANWQTLLAAPLGAVFLQLAACWGLTTRLLGNGIRWKDRQV